jgi:hypothetical protein
VPAVDRLDCRHGLCQRVSRLADQLNIGLPLGSGPVDQPHLAPTPEHQRLGDGAWGQQGLHGEHPPRDDQGAQHVLQDRDRMGLVRHGLWPSGQSQPVTEHGEQRRRWCPLRAAAS